MSFDMKTKDIVIGDDRGVSQCLEAWCQQIRKDGCGEMTVVRNGELTRIKVSNQRDRVDVELSDIEIHHTYKYFHEVHPSGSPELSKHFFAKVLGMNAGEVPVIVGLFINHTSEDGATWQKSLSVGFGIGILSSM